MIRVIKYKLYTLFHMVSFYIIMFIMTAFCLLLAFDYEGEDGVENLFHYARSYVLDLSFWSIFFTIFLAILFTAEYKNGFIKSIATNISKTQLIISNLIAATVVYVVYTAYVSVLAVIIGFFVVPDWYFGSILGLLSSVGYVYVVYMGLAAVLLAFSMMARGTALPVVVGIMICSQFTAIFATVIRAIFDADISRLQISYYFSNINAQASEAMLAGFVYLVIFGLVSLLIIKKKDV